MENQILRTHHSNLKGLRRELLHETLRHVVHDQVVQTFGTTTTKTSKPTRTRTRTKSKKSVGADRTGDGEDEVDGVGEAAEMRDGPIESVLAFRAVIHRDHDVASPPPLSALSVQLGLRHNRYQRRQHHFFPVVLLLLH